MHTHVVFVGFGEAGPTSSWAAVLAGEALNFDGSRSRARRVFPRLDAKLEARGL